MKELISVIIPCFNAGKTLQRTLFSVLEQDYKNLEIIIVNDGSTDNSIDIIKKFSSIDKRIVLIDQVNSGVSVARNNGLSVAKGEYIMFLDADDNYTTPFAISKMFKALIENDADMCVCDFTHPCFEKYTQGDKIFNLGNEDELLEFYQDFFLFGMPWNKITKKKCLTEKFVAGIKFNEDELFNIDNLYNINKVVFVDEVLHNYYCAPYNPNLPASAVNSIYSQDFFWEKRSTIWHMGMKNHEYRVRSLEKFFPHKKEELQFVRSFDFFFWDFFLMAKNRVKEEYVSHTCKTIFETELFQNTLKAKERYGLRLLNLTDDKIELFVKLAYNAFIDIKTYNKRLSMYKVFLGLFGKIFFELSENVNKNDILVLSYFDFVNNASAEGVYSRCLFERYEQEMNGDNKISLFEKNMVNWFNV